MAERINKLTLVLAAALGFFVCPDQASGDEACSVRVLDRTGTDVTHQATVVSDSATVIVDGVAKECWYRLIEQDGAPSESDWEAAHWQRFWIDLYFWMEPTTQWVRIRVAQPVGPDVEHTFRLHDGTPTAPPDDPIERWAFTRRMGSGALIAWRTRSSENLVVNMKRYGAHQHIKYHFNADYSINDDPVAREAFFLGWDKDIEWVIRHNMLLNVNLTFSNLSGDPSASDLTDFVTFIGHVSGRYRTVSHRLAFQVFAELGPAFADNWNKLPIWRERATGVIQGDTPGRMIIYGSKPYSYEGLVDPAYDAFNRVPANNTGYYMYEAHNYGAGLHKVGPIAATQKSIRDLHLQLHEWSVAKQIPVYVGIWMTYDYPGHGFVYPDRIKLAQTMMDVLNEYGLPAAYHNQDFYKDTAVHEGWEVGRVIVEVLNGDITIDPNDPDGDGLSTGREITLGTNPYHADTDNDGILDCHELDYGFNPLDRTDGDDGAGLDSIGAVPMGAGADFDGDGIPNKYEIYFSGLFGSPGKDFDPNNPNDAEGDYDGDGLKNREEIVWTWSNPYLDFKQSTDYDGDGLSNTSEIRVHRSHPRSTDSDGDGTGDKSEVSGGRDPSNPADGPWTPTARNDSASTYQNLPVLVDVLANDRDLQGDALAMVNFTQPPHGSVTLSNNKLRYEPHAGFLGNDSFTYRCKDPANHISGYATVSVLVSETASFASAIGHWSMDDAGRGTIVDSTGNNHHGTEFGTLAGAASDVSGGGMAFAGNGYVEISPSVFSSLNQEITVVLWECSGGNRTGSLFQAARADGQTVLQALYLSPTKIQWRAGRNPSTGIVDWLSYEQPPGQLQQWNHWAFTKHRGLGEMKIYCNGKQVAFLGRDHPFEPITGFRLGAQVNGTWALNQASLDESAIYGRVLTTTEIQRLSSLPPPAFRVAMHLPLSDMADRFLQWPGVPGKSYAVERTHDLSNDGWTRIRSNLPAMTPWNTFIDPDAPVSRAFYRIVEE